MQQHGSIEDSRIDKWSAEILRPRLAIYVKNADEVAVADRPSIAIRRQGYATPEISGLDRYTFAGIGKGIPEPDHVITIGKDQEASVRGPQYRSVQPAIILVL